MDERGILIMAVVVAVVVDAGEVVHDHHLHLEDVVEDQVAVGQGAGQDQFHHEQLDLGQTQGQDRAHHHQELEDSTDHVLVQDHKKDFKRKEEKK